MEGPAFEQLTDTEALNILPTLQVLARSRPQDKLRLVELLTNSGEVVAGLFSPFDFADLRQLLVTVLMTPLP